MVIILFLMKLKKTKNEKRRYGSDPLREILMSDHIKNLIISYYTYHKKMAHFSLEEL